MLPRERRPICHADCQLPSGQVLHLVATSVSPGGAFIVSMKAPPIGTRVLVSLILQGKVVLSLLVAHVIGVRLDPGDAGRSGFEVLFEAVDDNRRDILASLTSELPQAHAPTMGQFPAGRDEARKYPRVAVHLMAQVRTRAGNFTASVKNVSMSGALLVVDNPKGDAPLMLGVGATLRLILLSGSDDESVELSAEVVRQSSSPEPMGVGVRFAELEESQARRLERVILYSLIMDHFPHS